MKTAKAKKKLTAPEDGVHREFHANGKLRTEYTIKNGMRHGMMRSWHDNGQASSEVSFVKGQMSGRMRNWESDGMFYGAKYFFQWRPISKKKYLKLCEADPSLPRFLEEKTTNTLGNYVRKLRKEGRERAELGPTPEQTRAIQDWDSECELEAKEADSCEAIKWLTKKKRSMRGLGEMSKKHALNLVRKLYSAGAVKVWALRIEEDGDGAEYSKRLLIKLTKDPKQTGAFHKLCSDPARPYMDGSGPAIKVGQKYMTVFLL